MLGRIRLGLADAQKNPVVCEEAVPQERRGCIVPQSGA